MKNNSYNLNRDVLTIRTSFGQYKFKIEDSDLLDNVERIVRLMISEIDNADKKLSSRKERSGQYARLLLANLNLCEKYISLEDKYISLEERYSILTEKLQNINRKLDSATVLPQSQTLLSQELAVLPQSEPVVIEEPSPVTAEEPSPVTAEEPSPVTAEEPSPVTAEEPSPVTAELPSPVTAELPSPVAAELSAPVVAELSAPVVAESESARAESAPQTYMDKRATITSWKLKHSYIDLKRKAMERVLQVKSESHTVLESETEQESQSEERDESQIQADCPTESLQSDQISRIVEPSVTVEPVVIAPHTAIETSTPLSEMAVPLTTALSSIEAERSELLFKSDQAFIRTDALLPAPELAVKQNMTVSHREPDVQIPELHPAQTVRQPQPAYIINRPEQREHYIQKPKVYRKGEFQLPNLSFLKNTSKKTEVDHHSIRRDAELLEKKLGYFGIKGEVMGVSPGPVITTFEYRPEPGIKISKIVNLADDLALALSAFSIRIVAPIPGKDVMGIEIPNIKKSLVPFIDIVNSNEFINSRSKVPICLGKDIIGNPVVVELDKMPHLLIAGATGTGKSVGLNAMITSILYKSTPEEVKFLMVDPKRIELSFYNDIPHLLTPVITDMKKATIALQWMVREMDRRYSLLAKSQVRHIEQYNQKIRSRVVDGDGESEEFEQLPFIVVIIDELADLMMTASRDIEFSLTRLAQMARAAGIHLILATQRPSVDVLTGIIKANFPTRISFQVSSKTDSRTIIDSNGAETLLGNGDMLFVPPGTARLTRVHGTYLSEDELLDITSFLKAQGKPEYVLDVITETDQEAPQESMDDDYDDKYNEALEFVVATKQASISGIQRALRVGYNRAARIIDIMEKRGIVGPSDGVKPRRVIVENIEY